MNDNKLIDVELRDLLELFKRDTMLSLNCHAIGEIVTFDESSQTCEVKISYDRRYIENTSSGGVKEVKKSYPLLVDVPVVCLRGGSSGITFPIESGDSCIILFNDRDIDNWFEGKREGFVRSKRLHSMSDGVAIVGLSSKNDFIQAYDTARASLYNGTTRVAVSADKVLIENSLYTLNGLLQELITTIKGATIASAPLDGPVLASLTAVAIKIEGLLE